MPYSLVSDTLGRDPRWWKLADNKRQLRNELQAAYLRLVCETASHLDDGYLTEQQAFDCCDGRRRTLDLLCMPVLGGPPFLHRRGDRCSERNCLDDSGPWVDGFDYRVCGFAKRNPTKSEYTRNRSQKSDLRDSRLKAAVYDRDGGCCRYCRSGPLKKRGMGRARDRRRALQFDHVDPDRAATADGGNFVVACARCNEYKGRRLPAEAEMLLLPEPTEQDKAAWLERGEVQFDMPADNAHDKQHDNAHDKQQRQTTDNEPSFVGDACRDDSPTGDVCPASPAQRQQQPSVLSSEGSGPGRVGDRVVEPLSHSTAQPQRAPTAPDVYHRRSRAAPAVDTGEVSTHG